MESKANPPGISRSLKEAQKFYDIDSRPESPMQDDLERTSELLRRGTDPKAFESLSSVVTHDTM